MKLERPKLKQVRSFLQKKGYKNNKTLDYLDSLSRKKQFVWVIAVCKTLKSKPGAKPVHIKIVKGHFHERVEQLNNYEVTNDIEAKEIEWFANRIDVEFVEAVNRLKPLVGDESEWDSFENKIHRKGGKLQYTSDRTKREMNQDEQFEYWNEKLRQMEALEELFPDWKDICQIMTQRQELPKNKSKVAKRTDKVNPNQIAQKFKARSKTSAYSINAISFVMNIAAGNPNESNYAELVRNVKNDKDCPSEITKETKYDTVKRWIDFFDKEAGIMRK